MPKHPLRFILAGLIAGFLFNVLFYGRLPGISALLFACLLLAGVAAALYWTKTPLTRANLWLVPALLFFSGMIALRANGFLIFLNIVTSLALLALLALYLVPLPIYRLGLLQHLVAPVQALGLAIVRAVDVSTAGLRSAAPRLHGRQTAALPVLRGLLLAFPVLIIFTALLASADLIFADLIQRVFQLDFLDALDEWLARGLLITVVGFIVTGALAQVVWRNDPAATDSGVLQSLALPRVIGAVESTVALNAVNLLFLAFVIIQIPYLFGGATNVHPAGFTYADYARRGFGELVVTAVGVLGLLVGLGALTKQDTARQRKLFSLSSTVMVLLTTVMLASAFKRLLMYEQAYGFTQMRIYPHVFMVWLGLLLFWFVGTRWLRPQRFAVGVLIAALGFVATLNLINPDVLIVRENMARYQQGILSAAERGDTIDVGYFAQLSEDAVPALLTALPQLNAEDQNVLDNILLQKQEVLTTDSHRWRSWPSFNLARTRAWDALQTEYGGEGANRR